MKLDANNMLAGKKFTIELELVALDPQVCIRQHRCVSGVGRQSATIELELVALDPQVRVTDSTHVRSGVLVYNCGLR